MRRTTVSRRSVTRTLIGSALLAAAPGALLRGRGAIPSSIPASFTAVIAQFRQKVLAPFTGDELLGFLAAGRELAASTAGSDEVAVAAQVIGAELGRLTMLSEAEVRSRIEQNIRADFAADRSVMVGGWILSHTELLILSLAASSSKR